MKAIQELILHADKTIFFFFQRLQQPSLDYFLAWPTRLGETIMALSLLIFPIVILDRKDGIRKASVAAAGILTAHWISQYLKDFFNRPRPYLIWPETHVIFGKSFNSAAFPSGHTTVAFAAAFLADKLYPGKMRWAYAVAAWVGITRIYVGVHYPTDVLAGAVTGMACAALTCRLLMPKKV